MQNKNKKRKENERHTRYGRTARWLSVAMALVFSLTSVGAALPEAAESGASSVAESTVSGTGASYDATSTENAANSAQSAASSADTSDSTPHVTPNPTLTASEKAYESSVNVTEENKGTLTVTAKADAGVLPSDAVLTVKPITKENEDTSETYKQVEKKVKKDVADDNRELTGFLAYDISFIQNNEEIEPSGKVNVTMKWTDAAKPEGTTEAEQKDSDVSVLHLAKNKDGSKEIKDTEVVNLTENKEKGENKDNQATVEVKKDSKAVEKAEMTVDGFSVFTITWTTSTPNATRIGQVKLHYVDENGEELDTPTTQPTEEMLSQNVNGIVTLSQYAKDGDASRMANYTYKTARMGNAKTGDVITGLMVTSSASGNTTTYSLKYTAADPVPSTTSDSNWKTVPSDAVTGAKNNSVDVYLIYTENPYITVHYVDQNGDEFETADKKYIDNTWSVDAGITAASLAKAITGYTYNDDKNPRLGSISGKTVTSLKTSGIGESFTLSYKEGADRDNWIKTDARDVYLFYNKSNYTKKITIHHTDLAGIKIPGVDDTVIDAADWNGSVDLSTYAKTIDGYTLSTTNLNDNRMSGRSDDYDRYSQIWISSASDSSATPRTRGVTGVPIRWMRYNSSDQSINVGTGDSASNITWASDSITSSSDNIDVYLMYTPYVRIHAVDANDNELDVFTTSMIAGYCTGTNSSTSGFISGGSNIGNGNTSWHYGTRASYYTKNLNGNTVELGSGNGNIGTFWKFDTQNKAWSTRITGPGISGYKEISGERIADIYYVYPSNLAVTVHHVDKDGNPVADDTTTTLSATSTITVDGGNSTTKVSTDISGYAASSMVFGRTGSANGTPFTSMTYMLSNNTWSVTYSNKGGESTEVASAPNEIWVIYEKNSFKDITIHYVDTSGKAIAADTTKTITDNTTITPSTDTLDSDTTKALTNYTYSTAKFGMTLADGKVISGTELYSITYTKNADNAWSNGYKAASTDTTDTSIETAQDELWYVYTEKADGRAVTIHFVDESGNNIADPYDFTGFTVFSSVYKDKWNGGNMTGQSSITNSANYKAIPSGYSFIGEYLGPDFNKDMNKLVNSALSGKNAVQWYYDSTHKKWYTSHASGATTTHQLTDEGVYNKYITDIYWVYSKKDSKNLTLHYIHPVYDGNDVLMDSDGNPTYSQFKDDKGNITENNVTISYETVANKGDSGLPLNELDQAKHITDYTYYGSYLATPKTDGLPDYARLTTDAPHVRAVRVHNGSYQFLVVSGDGTRNLTLARRNQWSYTTIGGRTYTLRKTSSTEGGTTHNTFTMLDSMAGRSAYDLSLESTTTDDAGNTVNTYTGTSGAEGTGVAYSVTETVPKTGEAGSTSYKLTVYEWTGVSQHDIYQLYTKDTDTPVVTISNEVVYSGNLVARPVNLGDKTVVSYKWEKQVNNGEWTEVVRAQNGSEWNIAHDLKDRSWLDLAADNGELSNDEGRNSVKYRVTLTYSDGTSNHEVTSQEFSVPYWDQLENGSFETPDSNSATKVTSGYQVGGNYFDGTFYSNEYYKSLKGAWQTTGVGHDGNSTTRNGKDIEIINTTNDRYLVPYGFKSDGTKGTADGKTQFAELNAEAAGALYQDVVTYPNEYLNYWLSHRARGEDNNSGRQTTGLYFDTMYMVIMPTKLAMTSAADGGELKDQNDLETFIENHGGYEESGKGNSHTSEENKVIYRDTNSGVLVVRITSDNADWHSISVDNGYIATSSLTRFFFVAGPTAYHSNDTARNKTVGNLIDAVGFSQHLQTPTTPHYHMVVKKTFSGLTASDVANLVKGKSDTDKFKFTIQQYEDKNGAKASNYTFERDNDDHQTLHYSLNGAVLSFTADNSNNFRLTATVKDPNNSSKTINLLADSGYDTWFEDPDTGDITMTWTLSNNYFADDESTDDGDIKKKYFKITESGTDIDGYSVATTNNGTIEDTTTKDGTTSTTTTNLSSQSGDVTSIFTVKDRTTARINYNNTYRDNTENEPEKMTVQKKFYGITPSVVSNLMGSENPYQITVTNKDNQSITLVGNTDRPVRSNYPEGIEQVDLTTSVDPSTGVSTFTWTITGTQGGTWIASGDYTVTESNYEPSGYPITKISVNGKDIQNENTKWPQTVRIGSGADLPTLTANGGGVVNTNLSDTKTVSNDTNLIVAKYQHGTANEYTYIVWTPNTLGLNEKRAIITHLKSVTDFGATNAEDNAFQFRSGANPGNITIGNTGEAGSFYYNGTDHQLRLDNSENTSSGVQWKAYYATHYTLRDSQNATEIRITNSYQPSVRVLKVDGSDKTTVLKGANFKVFKLDKSTRQYLHVSGSTLSWAGTNKDDAVLTTNDEGIAEHKSGATALEIISQLQSGTYYIEETKAPDGYNMPTKPVVAFKVDEQGIVSKAEKIDINENVSNDVDQDRLVDIDWNSPYYTIHIINTSGFALPVTGGRGTLIFTILGLLLLFGGGTGLYLRRKRLKSMF